MGSAVHELASMTQRLSVLRWLAVALSLSFWLAGVAWLGCAPSHAHETVAPGTRATQFSTSIDGLIGKQKPSPGFVARYCAGSPVTLHDAHELGLARSLKNALASVARSRLQRMDAAMHWPPGSAARSIFADRYAALACLTVVFMALVVTACLCVALICVAVTSLALMFAATSWFVLICLSD
jgi:hypothetical protein